MLSLFLLILDAPTQSFFLNWFLVFYLTKVPAFFLSTVSHCIILIISMVLFINTCHQLSLLYLHLALLNFRHIRPAVYLTSLLTRLTDISKLTGPKINYFTSTSTIWFFCRLPYLSKWHLYIPSRLCQSLDWHFLLPHHPYPSPNNTSKTYAMFIYFFLMHRTSLFYTNIPSYLD